MGGYKMILKKERRRMLHMRAKIENVSLLANGYKLNMKRQRNRFFKMRKKMENEIEDLKTNKNKSSAVRHRKSSEVASIQRLEREIELLRTENLDLKKKLGFSVVPKG